MCTTPASNFWNTCTTTRREPYRQREHLYPTDTVVAAFVQALAQPSAWTALPLPPRLLRLCTHCPGALRPVARQPAGRLAPAALPAAVRRGRRPGSRTLPPPPLPRPHRVPRCPVTGRSNTPDRTDEAAAVMPTCASAKTASRRRPVSSCQRSPRLALPARGRGGQELLGSAAEVVQEAVGVLQRAAAADRVAGGRGVAAAA